LAITLLSRAQGVGVALLQRPTRFCYAPGNGPFHRDNAIGGHPVDRFPKQSRCLVMLPGGAERQPILGKWGHVGRLLVS